MPRGETPGGRVKTADTMFGVIEGLIELDGAGVSELASHLGIAKSTVHRHLTTLERHQCAVQEGDEYHVGLRFLEIGEYARERNPFYHRAMPLVDQIAEQTAERSLFILEEHGRAVYLYRGVGDNAVQTNSRVGTHRYLHTVAGGKAILAHLPGERVDDIVEQWGLPRVTDNTITDRETLYAELETVRERGVAFNYEECIVGLNAVAAPVFGPDGNVAGALSVSGPAHRMKGEWFEREVPDLLLGVANELELNVEYGN